MKPRLWQWISDRWRLVLLIAVALAVWGFGTFSFFARVQGVERRSDPFTDIEQYARLKIYLEGVPAAGFITQVHHRQKSKLQLFSAQYMVAPTALAFRSSRGRDFARMARQLLRDEVWVCYCRNRPFRRKLLDAAHAEAERRGFELELTVLEGVDLLVARRSAARKRQQE